MFGDLKRLGRETLVYGFSTVVGRLLNFFLLPFYTHTLAPPQLGVVAALFSYIAFLNVVYAYGMDFAFMREASVEQPQRKNAAFSTAFWSIAVTSLFFSALLHRAADFLGPSIGLAPELSAVVGYSAWILALDAMALVPFAELRLSHRAGAYAGIKIANIVITLLLNYLFLAKLKMGVRGVFLANLAASSATLTMLSPVIARKLGAAFDRGIWRSLVGFGLPLVPAGLASMMVQVVDRPIVLAIAGAQAAGIYQANYKLGIFMMLVVSMFDMAWRPFFLQKAQDPDLKEVLARVLTYFAAGGALIVLAVSLFISDIAAFPVLGRPLIHPAYWPGLTIVPVVLLGYLFNGLYVNFLAPVYLAKRSGLVVYATAAGAAVNVIANLVLIPRISIMGAAVATLLAYVAMAGVLHQLARRVFPIPYEYGRLAHLGAVFAAFAGIGALLFRLGGAPGFSLKLCLLVGMPGALAATGFFYEEEAAAFKNWLKRPA